MCMHVYMYMYIYMCVGILVTTFCITDEYGWARPNRIYDEVYIHIYIHIYIHRYIYIYTRDYMFNLNFYTA